MKQIGHVDGARTEQAWRTHRLGMLSPHDLFIPDPGERENVSADQWTLAGWVIPDKDGGTIYAHHRDASEDGDARPAYVRRPDPDCVEGPIRSMETVMLTPGKLDPMDVRRSEFDALYKRIDEIDVRLNRHAVLLPKPDEPTTVQAEQPMSFYDHAFIALAVQAISENNGVTKSIEIAHKLASDLTRNRAVPA